uniref:Uncharacterized protein n=1 Tax=Megaselia scalaris TaxID=36166 RepID=T1GX43_MEGSC
MNNIPHLGKFEQIQSKGYNQKVFCKAGSRKFYIAVVLLQGGGPADVFSSHDLTPKMLEDLRLSESTFLVTRDFISSHAVR